jgi:hypothetical protein
MEHESGAITVHVYSPPIRYIDEYEIHDGELAAATGTARRAFGPEPPAARSA